MKEASRTGAPLIRTMFYEFPEDEKCWNLPLQYMFGPDYLVAPIFEAGATERTLYLPAGKWQNIETGEIVSGGCDITVPAPIDVIPVFKRV